MATQAKLSPHHNHVFLNETIHVHERRTRIVIVLTASMMAVEIFSGFLFGSMALLADGWHMASHAAALSLSALGYLLARRLADDRRFSFGTGKIGDLAGFSSALILAVISVLMGYASLTRLFSPVSISFDEAIAVSVIGLTVNFISALVLNVRSGEKSSDHHSHHADYNLRSAYVHVLADAVTSVFAIVALTTGKFLGWIWMVPLMGIAGALVIARWSYMLMRDTARILLDVHTDETMSERIRGLIATHNDDRIADLHVWRIGPGHFAAIISILSKKPRPPEHYKHLLRDIDGLSHVTLEVNEIDSKRNTIR